MALQAHTDPTAPAPIAEWVDLSDEELRVRIWRFDQLVSLGFARSDAAVLACDTRAELSAARSLVEHGCPPALAARILG